MPNAFLMFQSVVNGWPARSLASVAEDTGASRSRASIHPLFPSGVTLRIAIYPGSFDPVTLGHWDLILRAEKLVDRLIVAVLHNPAKANAFSVAERVDFLRELTWNQAMVEVTSFDGLLVDYARRMGAHFIIRGVRAFSDFEYEFQMALMNRKLSPELETMFLMPKEEFSVVSSRIVREVGGMGGDISGLVPEHLVERISARLLDPELMRQGYFKTHQRIV
jgi:pantetheine-phosphate adenylyltransferase